MLEFLFRSKAEVKILGTVLFEEGLHLREIARRANVSSFEAKKELDNLVSMGVLLPEKRGNMIFFHLNKNCPFLNDLKQLFLKTEGIAFELKKSFEGLAGIEFAFIYGSFAKGIEREKSDLDLMVIGSIQEEVLAKHLMKLQKKFNREINFVLWAKNDFEKKAKEKSPFLKNLLKEKRIWLKGEENEFIRFSEK